MTTFLSDEAREHLVEGLTELGMPQDMAEEFAGWPDDADVIDVNLTALIHRAADYRDRMTAGDKSVTKYLIADIIMLVSYMSRVEERGWDVLQLPKMNEAMNGHNQRWGHPLQ